MRTSHKLTAPTVLSAVLLLGCAPTPRAAKADAAPELVLKQDFEKTDSVSEWRQWLAAGATPNSLTRDSVPLQSHAGQAALKYEITNASESEQYIICGTKLSGDADLAGRTLRLRFYARTTSPLPQNQQVAVRILERNSAKVIGWLEEKDNLLSPTLSSYWQEFSATAKLDTTARGLTLFVVFKKPRPGQVIWLDDLSVEVIPPAEVVPPPAP